MGQLIKKLVICVFKFGWKLHKIYPFLIFNLGIQLIQSSDIYIVDDVSASFELSRIKCWSYPFWKRRIHCEKKEIASSKFEAYFSGFRQIYRKFHIFLRGLMSSIQGWKTQVPITFLSKVIRILPKWLIFKNE